MRVDYRVRLGRLDEEGGFFVHLFEILTDEGCKETWRSGWTGNLSYVL